MPQEQRKLAAILAADEAGYSRLVGLDEIDTHRRLMALRSEVLEPLIGDYGGRVVSYAGDGSLDHVEIVRHYFERDTPPPVTIAETPVTIREVVHYRQLAPGREAPGELVYILFGSGEKRYMTHLLSAQPDFDQHLKVHVDGALESATGPIFVTLGPRSNKVEDRLTVGEVIRCSGVEHMLHFKVEAEVYCEAGELEFAAGEGRSSNAPAPGSRRRRDAPAGAVGRKTGLAS